MKIQLQGPTRRFMWQSLLFEAGKVYEVSDAVGAELIDLEGDALAGHYFRMLPEQSKVTGRARDTASKEAREALDIKREREIRAAEEEQKREEEIRKEIADARKKTKAKAVEVDL